MVTGCRRHFISMDSRSLASGLVVNPNLEVLPRTELRR